MTPVQAAFENFLIHHPWIHFEFIAILMFLMGLFVGMPVGMLIENLWAKKTSQFISWVGRHVFRLSEDDDYEDEANA